LLLKEKRYMAIVKVRKDVLLLRKRGKWL